MQELYSRFMMCSISSYIKEFSSKFVTYSLSLCIRELLSRFLLFSLLFLFILLFFNFFFVFVFLFLDFFFVLFPFFLYKILPLRVLTNRNLSWAMKHSQHILFLQLFHFRERTSYLIYKMIFRGSSVVASFNNMGEVLSWISFVIELIKIKRLITQWHPLSVNSLSV